MATVAKCLCGFTRQLTDYYAGKVVECPSCGREIQCTNDRVYRLPPGDWSDDGVLPALAESEVGRSHAPEQATAHPGSQRYPTASFQTEYSVPQRTAAANYVQQSLQVGKPPVGTQFDSCFDGKPKTATAGRDNCFVWSLAVLALGLFAFMLAPEWRHAKPLAVIAVGVTAATFISRLIGGRGLAIALVACALSGFSVYKVHRHQHYLGSSHRQSVATSTYAMNARGSAAAKCDPVPMRQERKSSHTYRGQTYLPRNSSSTIQQLDFEQLQDLEQLSHLANGLVMWSKDHGGINDMTFQNSVAFLSGRGLFSRSVGLTYTCESPSMFELKSKSHRKGSSHFVHACEVLKDRVIHTQSLVKSDGTTETLRSWESH